MPTREAILGKLKKERDRLFERYRSMSAAQLEANVTQSEAEDGSPWNPKDHLAHLCAIERSFQRMIRETMDGSENPTGLRPAGQKSDRANVLARVHRGNEKEVNLRRGENLDSLFEDLEAARRETIQLVESLNDAQLGIRVPGAPWGDGTIGGVLITNGYHEQQHLHWVEQGLGERTET